MQRDTPNNETVTVEYGFIDSPKDDVEQIKNNYENYAEAVIRAVLDYKNLPYKAPVGEGYYTVKKGDNLWDIAHKYGMTVSELKELNKLSTNNLKIGQTLKIAKNDEKNPDEYLIYKVKNGDNLWDIAKKYDTTVSTLKSINNLKSDNLTINQQLFIPKTNNSGTKNDNIYTVKKGDTLYDIAEKYNVSINDIKEKNNLKSNMLKIGQVLEIPNSSTGEVNYIVQNGDNLNTIANKYGVTVSDIKKLNNLKTNTLQIGQVLKIPGSTNYNTYIVKSGDSLWKIANKYNTTVNKLKTINNLDSTVLQIGQKLLLPTT